MKLSIVTPSSSRSVKISWVEFNTPQGNFIIQPGHAPGLFVLAPEKPIVFCLVNGKQESLGVVRGVAHVNRKHTVLLLNEAA